MFWFLASWDPLEILLAGSLRGFSREKRGAAGHSVFVLIVEADAKLRLAHLGTQLELWMRSNKKHVSANQRWVNQTLIPL